MDTQFSVEITTTQKIKDLRNEAAQYRLLSRTEADRPERSSFTGRFFSWIFRKPGMQQNDRRVITKGTT